MIARRTLLATAAAAALAGGASADCAFDNPVDIKMLSAGFEAWKAVAAAAEECGNFQAELDQEFRTKQPAAFAADPALYHVGGVANGTLVPLLNEGTIRPLDDLVAEYGQNLTENQLIRIDGRIMAIAMMVNAQHLMYRRDVFEDLGLEPPQTYSDMLGAAEAIREAGLMEHPIGATMATGWNLGQDFVNMFLAHGGTFFADDNTPMVKSEAGVAALETMEALTDYMDPEFLVSDSTYVQKQFQQGEIAMANLWASRAGAMNDPAESDVVGKVAFAGAPAAEENGSAATTMWWDGFVIARNIPDDEAEAAFRVMMEALDEEMVSGANDAAVWLVPGYEVTDLAQGVIESLQAGAPPYPASAQMGMMHTALGNNVADYLTGAKDAEATLAAIEQEYLTAAGEAGLVQ